MSRVFFTSDLHFGHYNLCESLRGMSAEESDKLIIENWNKVVNKKDLVYILGDITMEKSANIEQYMSQLKGSKYIIGGNHDTKRCCKEYQRLGIPVLGCLAYKGFICTHIPIHPFELEYYRGNIHGHIHLSGDLKDVGEYYPKNPEGRYYNVNTEFHNYTPILFDDIVEYFETNFKEEDNG